jgi:hypothetical protein
VRRPHQQFRVEEEVDVDEKGGPSSTLGAEAPLPGSGEAAAASIISSGLLSSAVVDASSPFNFRMDADSKSTAHVFLAATLQRHPRRPKNRLTRC